MPKKKGIHKLENLQKSLLIKNKRANFDYQLIETWEAGIELTGMEVKAIKNGQMSLTGAYVTVKNSSKKPELYLLNANVSPYIKSDPKHLDNYDPRRSRRLLLHRKEINSIIGKMQEKHLTLIPVKVYTRNNKIKIEIALAKGKKKFDKKEAIKERDVKRKLNRILKTQI